MPHAYQASGSSSSGNAPSDPGKRNVPADQLDGGPSADDMQIDFKVRDPDPGTWSTSPGMEDSSQESSRDASPETMQIDSEEEEEVEEDDPSQLPEPLTYMHLFSKYNTRVPVTLIGNMVEEDLKHWGKFEDWEESLLRDPDLKRHPDYVYHQEPLKLNSIRITAMDHFGMDLKADLRNSEVKHSYNYTLAGPVNTTTKVGVIITIQRASEKANPELAEKLLLLIDLHQSAAGRMESLQLPMGILGTDDEVRNITAKKEMNSLCLGRPWRKWDLSKMIRSRPRLGTKVYKRLGILKDEEMGGQIFNDQTYGQVRMVLWEFVLQDDDFNSLKKKMRFSRKKKVRDESSFVNDAAVYLVPLSRRPWVGSEDIHLTLAWALYKALNKQGVFKRKTKVWKKV